MGTHEGEVEAAQRESWEGVGCCLAVVEYFEQVHHDVTKVVNVQHDHADSDIVVPIRSIQQRDSDLQMEKARGVDAEQELLCIHLKGDSETTLTRWWMNINT